MRRQWETFKVKGEDLLKFVKMLIHEGNVRRVIIRQGSRTVAEFPMTVGLVGAVAAPGLAALGAAAALLTECTIEVERGTETAAPATPRGASRARRDRGRKA